RCATAGRESCRCPPMPTQPRQCSARTPAWLGRSRRRSRLSGTSCGLVLFVRLLPALLEDARDLVQALRARRLDAVLLRLGVEVVGQDAGPLEDVPQRL